MHAQDEQRNIPPFKDPTYEYRRRSKHTKAELLGKVFGYRSAVYAEFESKEQCSYEANVDLQMLCFLPYTHSLLVTGSLFSFWRIIPPPFPSTSSEQSGGKDCDRRPAYWLPGCSRNKLSDLVVYSSGSPKSKMVLTRLKSGCQQAGPTPLEARGRQHIRYFFQLVQHACTPWLVSFESLNPLPHGLTSDLAASLF